LELGTVKHQCLDKALADSQILFELHKKHR
jgi:hypothetical protein